MSSDFREFVNEYFETNKITILKSGDLTDPLGRNKVSIRRTLCIDYRDYVKLFNKNATKGSANLRPDNDKTLHNVIDEKIDNFIREYKAAFRKSVKCETENLEPLNQFIEALTGKRDTTDIYVMAHWLWQVKRKLNGLPVKDHIMVALYGKQGCGKTEAVAKLLHPFRDYKTSLTIDKLSDERYSKALEHSLVWVCDELQGISKLEISALKRIITADEVSHRELYTQDCFSVKQNTSFIATTNAPLNTQLFDSTGSRRFYQLDVKNNSWDMVNSVDYLALWSGIDEKLPNGYRHNVKAALETAQQDLVVKSELEEFLYAGKLSQSGEYQVEISSAELFKKYIIWCENCKIRKPKNLIWFARGIAALGYEKTRRADDNGFLFYTTKPTPKLESVPSNNSIEDDLVFDEPFDNVQALKDWSKIVKNHSKK